MSRKNDKAQSLHTQKKYFFQKHNCKLFGAIFKFNFKGFLVLKFKWFQRP